MEREEKQIGSLLNFKASLCNWVAQRVPNCSLLSELDALVKAHGQVPHKLVLLHFAHHHGLWTTTTPSNQMEIGTGIDTSAPNPIF